MDKLKKDISESGKINNESCDELVKMIIEKS